MRPRRRRAWRWFAAALLVVGAVLAGLIWLGGEPDDVPTGPGLAKRLAAAVRGVGALDCRLPGAWSAAAEANEASLHELVWPLSGQEVLGWEIYAPLVGQELASSCPPASEGFASALARWQAANRLPANGRMDAQSFQTMWVAMLRRRPFVQAMREGCPPPALPETLEFASPEETYGARTTIMARRDALQAYRSLLAAARAEEPAIRADPAALKIVSAFRPPQADGGDCPPGPACWNLTRANCSAHRTGLAFDLYLGASPGRDPTSTADDNRLYQSQTPTYRWLVGHAARFGFLPYPYEPWHWEWAGAP